MPRSRRRQQPDFVRVATLDVAHSHRRSAVVFGPVELPALDVLIARFEAMAAAGPAARVGLVPSTTTARWRFSPEMVSQAVTAVAREPGSDPVTLLTTLRQNHGLGVRILVAGDYLAIDFSHGLGEVPLLDMLVAVLFDCVDPTDESVWAPYRHSVPLLLTAGVRSIGLGPQRLLPLWRQHLRNVGTAHARTGTGSVSAVPPSPATRVGRISAQTVTELRKQRDSRLPGVSMFALYTYALHEALADAGFDVDPVVTLPFDARGYLPAGQTTLASFSAGLEFSLDRLAGPRSLHAQMSAASRMARPVANLMVGSMKMRAAMRSGWTPEWQVPTHPRIQLLHSSIGNVPRSPWSFSDRDEARVLVASDPVSPCGVTVTSATVTGALWFTAEFHDSLFDADRVGAALESVADRTRSIIGR